MDAPTKADGGYGGNLFPPPVKPILDGAEGFKAVYDAMTGSDPVAVGKLGTVELQLAYFRFKTRHTNALPPTALLGPLCRNAGLFPPNPEIARKMADELLKACVHFTITSPWWGLPESLELYGTLSRPAKFVSLQSLECFLSPDPAQRWTNQLASGTRVLVVSPFAKTIESQVPKLDRIFPGLWNPHLIFTTLKCPLSYGIQDLLTQSRMLSTWTDSLGLLEDLKKQIAASDADVVLIGAGLYSLPLMAHAKINGKKAIHLGGATQLFFGIRGGRWDTMPDFQKFFNEFWVRPSSDERPANNILVENGCYW